jgi:hypothetical protein
MNYSHIIQVQKFKNWTEVEEIQAQDWPESSIWDMTKSFSLVECHESYKEVIQKRITALGRPSSYPSKNTFLMCRIVLIPDLNFLESLTPEEEDIFFKKSVIFFQNRYGNDNVFSAVVRMEEGTRRMSVCLVPIHKGSLMASQIFTSDSLFHLQTSFHQAFGKNWRKYNVSEELREGVASIGDRIFGLIVQAEDLQNHASVIQRTAQEQIESSQSQQDMIRGMVASACEEMSRTCKEACDVTIATMKMNASDIYGLILEAEKSQKLALDLRYSAEYTIRHLEERCKEAIRDAIRDATAAKIAPSLLDPTYQPGAPRTKALNKVPMLLVSAAVFAAAFVLMFTAFVATQTKDVSHSQYQYPPTVPMRSLESPPPPITYPLPPPPRADE